MSMCSKASVTKAQRSEGNQAFSFPSASLPWPMTLNKKQLCQVLRDKNCEAYPNLVRDKFQSNTMPAREENQLMFDWTVFERWWCLRWLQRGWVGCWFLLWYYTPDKWWCFYQRDLSFYMLHAKSLQLCPTLWTPWTVAHQASLSLGFSRFEYWSGLPCPPPGDLRFRGKTKVPVSAKEISKSLIVTQIIFGGCFQRSWSNFHWILLSQLNCCADYLRWYPTLSPVCSIDHVPNKFAIWKYWLM